MTEQSNITLGELTLNGGGFIQTGPFGSQLHASDYVEQGIPCIMPVNLKGNRVVLDGIACISEEDANRLSKHIVRENDIVYSRRGDITQKALITEKEDGYFCGTGCLLIRPGTKANSEFLAYYLGTEEVKTWLLNRAVGITMPNLNTSILSGLPLQLPSMDCQDSVVRTLSSIDTKISLNNHINQELEAMAKLIYDYWFVQFDFPISEEQAASMGKPELAGNPYKASGGKMVYNEQLKREIPEGWEVKKLGDIEPNIITGKTPSTKVSDYFNGDIPFICIGDVRGNMHIVETELTLTEKGANTQCKKYIPAGSICVTCIASPGLVAFASRDSQTNQQLNSVICSKSRNRYFLYFYLKDHFNFTKAKTGNTFANMNKGDFTSIIVAHPESKVLEEFEELVGPIIEKVLINQKQNQKLSELRDWLLPMLMNGQVSLRQAQGDTSAHEEADLKNA